MPGPIKGAMLGGGNPLPQVDNNRVNNQPPVNGAGEVQPGGAQNIQPGGGVDAQGPAAEQARPRATDFVGELDVLLMKAARNVDVSSKDVTKAAKGAKLTKALRNELTDLAKAAEASIKALNAFSGRDLAAAMVRGENGEISFKAPYAGGENDRGVLAGQAIQAALDTQNQLSSALAKALAETANGKSQAALEELMLQVDRRSGEITTLMLQMADIVAKGGADALENAAKLTGDGKISDFTSANALDKYGRNETLAALRDSMKPLIDRLNTYLDDNSISLTKADIDSCIAEANALKDRFSSAAAEGKLTIGERTIFFDRTMLNEASKLLGGIDAKIKTLHQEVIRGAMKLMVENDIPFLKDDIFSAEFVEELGNIYTEGEGSAQELGVAMKRIHAFRAAARAYADAPTKANEAQLLLAVRRLANTNLYEAAESLEEGFVLNAKPQMGASPKFKAAFKAFQDRERNTGCAVLSSIKSMMPRFFSHIDIAAHQLIKLGKSIEKGPDAKYFVSGALLGAFNGEISFSTLLESRVHGYADSEINAVLDDKNVKESQELGHGNFNTVTLVKMNDNTEWVFKPEMEGRLTAPGSPLNDGMGNGQQMTRVNLAVQTTADNLGLNDIMVKTTAGTHKGKFGMFMQKAPGQTGDKFSRSTDFGIGPGKLSAESIQNIKDDATFAKVTGRIMRQLNRLQWFDIITGQGDRNNSNYMIEIDKNNYSVTLKAIDNDASYGIMYCGLGKLHLHANTGACTTIGNTINKMIDDTDEDHEDAVETFFEQDPGFKRLKDGSIEIDMMKTEKPILFAGMLQSVGPKTAAVPAEIDQELFDQLNSLAKDAPDGGAKRRAHLDTLAKSLGKNSAQYKFAVNRLDESIDYARKLQAQGRVYKAEDWENHDVQREIAKPNLKLEKGRAEFPDGATGSARKLMEFTQRGQYAGCTNMFFRDMSKQLLGRNRKNWFQN